MKIQDQVSTVVQFPSRKQKRKQKEKREKKEISGLSWRFSFVSFKIFISLKEISLPIIIKETKFNPITTKQATEIWS